MYQNRQDENAAVFWYAICPACLHEYPNPYKTVTYEENEQEGGVHIRIPRRKDGIFKPSVLTQVQVVADTN